MTTRDLLEIGAQAEAAVRDWQAKGGHILGALSYKGGLHYAIGHADGPYAEVVRAVGPTAVLPFARGESGHTLANVLMHVETILNRHGVTLSDPYNR